MIWNRIINWFKDLSERQKTINEFNNSAREAFVTGIVSTHLVASSTNGDGKFKHENSKIFNSGFRIKTSAGKELTKEEILVIGRIVLNNTLLTRRLYVLGWDTLEVEDTVGKKGCKWAIKDFVKLDFMIGGSYGG